MCLGRWGGGKPKNRCTPWRILVAEEILMTEGNPFNPYDRDTTRTVRCYAPAEGREATHKILHSYPPFLPPIVVARKFLPALGPPFLLPVRREGHRALHQDIFAALAVVATPGSTKANDVARIFDAR